MGINDFVTVSVEPGPLRSQDPVETGLAVQQHLQNKLAAPRQSE